MLQPLKKLKENLEKRKKAKIFNKIKNEKEPQMYKKPSGAEDSFRYTMKKGGAVKKVTAKKVMVKSKKK
jgi:hypothetical protein